MDQLPRGETFVLVEYGGDLQEECDTAGRAMIERPKELPHQPDAKMYDNAQDETDIWEIREQAIGSTRSRRSMPAGRLGGCGGRPGQTLGLSA